MTKKNEYTAENIEVLDPVRAVRTRPAMYISNTAELGLHHIVYEVIDNSVDEHLAGYCNKIDIIIHKDNSITIQDNGRGIPVEEHPTQKGKSTIEVVHTILHAGGKFNHDTYKYSGGLHGVGVSVTTFLSSWLEVEVSRNGAIYKQRFEKGLVASKLEKIGVSKKNGTRTTFQPDPEIFSVLEFNYDILATRFRELAFLNSGLTIAIKDERTEEPKSDIFCFPGGVIEFIKHLNRGKQTVTPSPIIIQKVQKYQNSKNNEEEEIQVECIFQYNESYSENFFSFANNINTKDGGVHVSGFRSALTRTINAYAKKNDLLKKFSEDSFSGEDVREGLIAILNLKVMNPQFEGQNKGKLLNAEIQGLVDSIISESLTAYFEENPATAKKIVGKVLMAATARLAARKAKDIVRKSVMEGGSLPGKLSDCSSRSPEECEIFLVEGDSAGGSAKQGRDRHFQAILPLRGKVINVEKARLDKILANTEIKSIIIALGTGIGNENFDLSKLRYNKIIICADADVDGQHIRTLLLTFFYRYLPELILRGHVYIAQSPLYKVKKGKFEQYILKDEDLQSYLLELGTENVEVTVNDQVLNKYQLNAFVRCFLNLLIFEHLIQRKGMSLQDYLDLEKNAYSEDEYLEIIKQMSHKTLTGEIVQDDEEEIAHNIVEFPEGVEIQNILEALSKIGLDGRHYLSKMDKPYLVKSKMEELKAYSILELGDCVRKTGSQGVGIVRYKGLGELNADELWHTTMNPANRNLIQVTIEDAVEVDRIFSILMGDDVAARRSYIQKHSPEVRNLDV
jgi:DNA gyrase subunit B